MGISATYEFESRFYLRRVFAAVDDQTMVNKLITRLHSSCDRTFKLLDICNNTFTRFHIQRARIRSTGTRATNAMKNCSHPCTF